MVLRKVTEEEIQKVHDKKRSDAEYNEYDGREGLIKMFDLLDSYVASLQKNVEKLKMYMFQDSPNPYFINLGLKDISVVLRRLVKKTGEIGRYSGYSGRNEMSDVLGEDFEITRDGERLHIVFQSLLPKKIERKSNQAVYSNADIRMMYEPTFTKFFSNDRHVIYSKKAAIIYTHYFSSSREFIDHDNFETKIITDLITSNLLLDDTPKNCMIVMDYKMAEHSHTEVDVIPADEILEFLKENASYLQ